MTINNRHLLCLARKVYILTDDKSPNISQHQKQKALNEEILRITLNFEKRVYRNTCFSYCSNSLTQFLIITNFTARDQRIAWKSEEAYMRLIISDKY